MRLSHHVNARAPNVAVGKRALAYAGDEFGYLHLTFYAYVFDQSGIFDEEISEIEKFLSARGRNALRRGVCGSDAFYPLPQRAVVRRRAFVRLPDGRTFRRSFAGRVFFAGDAAPADVDEYGRRAGYNSAVYVGAGFVFYLNLRRGFVGSSYGHGGGSFAGDGPYAVVGGVVPFRAVLLVKLGAEPRRGIKTEIDVVRPGKDLARVHAPEQRAGHGDFGKIVAAVKGAVAYAHELYRRGHLYEPFAVPESFRRYAPDFGGDDDFGVVALVSVESAVLDEKFNV